MLYPLKSPDILLFYLAKISFLYNITRFFISCLLSFTIIFFPVVFGIISSAGVGGFREYLDPASAIITFGGAFSCTLMSMSLQNYIAGLKSFTLIFKAPALNTS